MAGFQDASVAEATDPEAFTNLLSDAANACHERLMARHRDDPAHKRFATTLTLFLGLWPQAYILQKLSRAATTRLSGRRVDGVGGTMSPSDKLVWEAYAARERDPMKKWSWLSSRTLPGSVMPQTSTFWSVGLAGIPWVAMNQHGWGAVRRQRVAGCDQVGSPLLKTACPIPAWPSVYVGRYLPVLVGRYMEDLWNPRSTP